MSSLAAQSFALSDLVSNVVCDRLEKLATCATFAASADGAVIGLQAEDGSFALLCQGLAESGFGIPECLQSRMLEGDLWPGGEGYEDALEGLRAACPGLGFVASTVLLRGGDAVGFLLVCGTGERPRLSGAQEYVLRTLAAEVSGHLHAPLSPVSALEAISREKGSSAASERLRLLESVVVNANDAVLITEAEPISLPGPRILYANAAFTRTTGYTLEEIIGNTPRMLHGPETDREPLLKLKEALLAWKPVEIELLNYKKDGTKFWVELSIVPVADESGWYTHWVSVQRDVSERKRHEENAVRLRLAEAHNEALAKELLERARVEAELARAAFHDNLTGLRNRAYFMDCIKGAVDKAQHSSGYQCAVMFLDLDKFKEINDRFGHSVGDVMLIEVARRLKACARPWDTVARMGGDEYTILLDGVTGVKEISAIARRVLDAMAERTVVGDHEIVLEASIGLTTGPYADPEHMLRDADTAMYRAKQQGGRRYAIFNEEMHVGAMASLNYRADLRDAMEKGEFVLHYQPLVDIGKQAVCGAEALLRWQHPRRGMVSPLEFVGITEETGMIVPLGAWVLDEACRQLASWRKQLPPGQAFKMSVNVSTRQLEEASFLKQLKSSLATYNIHPGQLQLEITESVFLKNAEKVGALLQRIRQLGVHIACDDFGTGYSSLSYLQLYPIDTIKIDQSFVRKLESGEKDADIVRMVVALAASLRMHVSAEGVERPQQRDILRDLGCCEVQGHLYGKPVPAGEMKLQMEDLRGAGGRDEGERDLPGGGAFVQGVARDHEEVAVS